jgi:hypothetical protein
MAAGSARCKEHNAQLMSLFLSFLAIYLKIVYQKQN